MLVLVLTFSDFVRADSVQSKLDLPRLLDSIAVMVHGPEREYKGTPSLCAVVDQAFNGPVDHVQTDRNCLVRWRPNNRALITPAISGNLGSIIEDKGKFERTLSTLAELDSMLRKGSQPNATQKVAVQMLLWELYIGLDKAKQGAVPAQWDEIDRLSKATHGVLARTLMSQAEIDSLPATLPKIPGLVGLPGMQDLVRSLQGSESRFLEIVNPSILHTMMTDGRLITRVFLATEDSLTNALLQFDDVVSTPRNDGMTNHTTGPASLKRTVRATTLPEKAKGLHAILLLFTAVLDVEWTIRPTEIVTHWQEYKITDLAPSPAGRQRYEPGYGNHISFRSVELLRLDGSQDFEFLYELVDTDSIEPVGILPRSTSYDGGLATTHRDNCLGCHFHRVVALNTREPRLFRFEKPFSSPVPAPVSAYWQQLEALE